MRFYLRDLTRLGLSIAVLLACLLLNVWAEDTKPANEAGIKGFGEWKLNETKETAHHVIPSISTIIPGAKDGDLEILIPGAGKLQLRRDNDDYDLKLVHQDYKLVCIVLLIDGKEFIDAAGSIGADVFGDDVEALMDGLDKKYHKFLIQSTLVKRFEPRSPDLSWMGMMAFKDLQGNQINLTYLKSSVTVEYGTADYYARQEAEKKDVQTVQSL